MIPIVQQLPGRWKEGRCLIVGFATDSALIITENGSVTWWPLSEVSVEWHYDADAGEFVSDFADEYEEEPEWALFEENDAQTDELPQVSGELHQTDRVGDGDPPG